jgi:hypothetical protein
MAIVCEHCRRTLEFSGEPPKFCAYCGVRLNVVAQTTVSAPPGATLAGTTAAYEGSPDTIPDEARFATPPASVGGYRLLRQLGAGGMGTVYEAECSTTGQRVAVKLLGAPLTAHPTALERFRQEGQLASLIAHPRCVFVLAAEEEAGRPYIVMELMPGETLRDLVERRGPLPPLEAVAKILDVVEGLREAHRLGIVHRDVKPSNCFLMPDGRVKVGDFGLSKSLTGDVNLTQTGAFLGTVLFASPEQVRGEGVGYAADVYSTCATLYFLLTGRAPFEHANAGAVVAKVVSEDPPSVRQLRPDVPRRLEKIVLKGLERDKAKRWQTLDDLHAALRSLIPGRMTRGSLGLRFAAYLIDSIVLFLLNVLVALAFRLGREEFVGDRSWVGDWLGMALEFAYFAVAEGVWGAGVGKLCLRLRVCPVGGTEPPPWSQLLLRTAVFVGCLHVFNIDHLLGLPDTLVLVFWVGAVAALLAPMRSRNGYRGLHELASGTRVVQLPWTLRRRPLRAVRERYAPRPLPPERYPAEVGPFHVRGLMREDDSGAVLLAGDPGLGREVHLWLRPAGAAPLPPARRSLARPTRTRWLAGGETGGRVWDAFFAPPGCPLADLVTPHAALGWTEARFILEQLAEELHDARADGTLPAEVGLDQFWVLPDGRVQLLDFDLDQRPGCPPDDAGALELLRQSAVLALEGAGRPEGAPPAPIRAPVPRHAVELLDHLLGVREPFASLAEFRTALAETHDRPTEATRSLRAAHVGVQAVFLALGVVGMLAFSGLFGLFDLTFRWDHVQRGEAALAMLRDPAAVQEKLRPVLRRYDFDGQLEERLEQQLAEDRAQLRERLHGANLAEHILFNLIQQATAREDRDIGRAGFVNVAERARPELDLGPTVQESPGREHSPERFREVFEGYGVLPYAVLAAFPVIWVVWAFLTRGGLVLRLMGLALVRPDGRKASRWQCAWRALLVWVPVVVPLAACIWVKVYAPQMRFLHTGLWWLAEAVLLGEVILAVLRPQRAPHDRLAGTALVPL